MFFFRFKFCHFWAFLTCDCDKATNFIHFSPLSLAKTYIWVHFLDERRRSRRCRFKVGHSWTRCHWRAIGSTCVLSCRSSVVVALLRRVLLRRVLIKTPSCHCPLSQVVRSFKSEIFWRFLPLDGIRDEMDSQRMHVRLLLFSQDNHWITVHAERRRLTRRTFIHRNITICSTLK